MNSSILSKDVEVCQQLEAKIQTILFSRVSTSLGLRVCLSSFTRVSPTGFHAAIFSRSFLSGHARRTKRKREFLELLIVVGEKHFIF